MDKIILLSCSFVSCVIIVSIIFEFLNDRYLKSFNNRYCYIALYVISITILTYINMFMNPFFNGGTHIVLCGIISYLFYYEDGSKNLIRVIETEVLFIVIVISEGIGVFLINALLNIFNVTPEEPVILQSIETAFSKIVLLFLYYAVFYRLWKKSLLRTKTQSLFYIVLFIYSVVNILITAIIADNESPIIIILNLGCLIFINMFLLYFIRFSDERNYYKLQVDMMQQQQKLQYISYEMQREKYTEAMTVLHDIEKHIKVIEGLQQKDLKEEVTNYAKQINEMFRPLIPLGHISNPVLNCLLSDKLRTAERLGIIFEIDISEIDIDFMEPIDITTLFGNLIDNAITASNKCTNEKYISLSASAYNDMVSIRIQNSIQEVVTIKNNKIVCPEKDKSCIGLMNIQRCVDTYDGSIIYRNLDNLLVCDIVLNKVDN